MVQWLKALAASRGPRLDSQYPCGGSHYNFSARESNVLSGHYEHQTHTWCTDIHTCRQNTNMYKINIFLKKRNIGNSIRTLVLARASGGSHCDPQKLKLRAGARAQCSALAYKALGLTPELKPAVLTRQSQFTLWISYPDLPPFPLQLKEAFHKFSLHIFISQ